MRRNPLIIGAGLAGSAAAITLGRTGLRPILIERAHGPSDKVCGDFLSSDTIERACSFGVDPAALGAARINRVRLVHGDRTAESALPFPAMGLSRRALDAALLAQAVEAGADVRLGQAVRRLARGNDGNWTVHTGNGSTLTADTVFLATGKHDVRDLPRPHGDRDAVGMKMYFELRPDAWKCLEGFTELTLFRGGYAGLQHVENGASVLCIAIQRSAFLACGGNWGALVATIGQGSKRFAGMLAGARALLPRPLAVAGVPYGHRARQAPPDGLFRLGDQAAVIPSLTGDGMAIALHSGRRAAETWLAGQGAATYQRSFSSALAWQMRLAGLLHWVCMSPAAQFAGIQAAAWFPALLRQAAQRTRLRSALHEPSIAAAPSV